MVAEQHRQVLAAAPASELLPFPGGGFELGEGWTSSVGFDSSLYYQGTRSGILRTGGTFFWQDFANPKDLSVAPSGGLVVGYSVRTYWDPPPGLWRGFLQLTMTDLDFDSTNFAEWKQEVYRSQAPVSDSLQGWATVVFPVLGGPVDFSRIFSVSFAVGAVAGGPGFAGDPRIDDLRMIVSRGGSLRTERTVQPEAHRART